jgi:hypothetical protein
MVDAFVSPCKRSSACRCDTVLSSMRADRYADILGHSHEQVNTRLRREPHAAQGLLTAPAADPRQEIPK